MSIYEDGADKRHDEVQTIEPIEPRTVRVGRDSEWFPKEILQQARDVVMDDTDDVVIVESEDFEVTPSELRATLWNARTDDPLTDVYAPAGETRVAEVEVEKMIAIGDNDGASLAPNAKRGIINLQIEATTDEPRILRVTVRTRARDPDPDHRPEQCECDGGDALPCRYCFVDGFNAPTIVE